MGIFSLLKPKKKYRPEEVLNAVHYNRGMLWEKIEQFKVQLGEIQGAATHELGKPQEEDMQEHYPLKHHFEGGLYTREVFMPKGHIIVSFIHKKQHPSFLLKGKVSLLNDDGVVETVEAPHTVFTQIGTQRVFYVHEDAIWTCVHKTNATTVEEAEKELLADSYRELPKKVINKALEICQQ